MKNKLVRVLTFNVLVVLAIYLGAWRDIKLIGWAVVAFVWSMVAMYFSALYAGKRAANISDPLPRGVGWMLDATCIFMFVYANWYVTATAYAVSAIVLEVIYQRSNRTSV